MGNRTRRAVPLTPVAYSTYAPPGHSCADCKSLISPDVPVIRLADDHIANGQASPDYRHLTCFYPKPRRGTRGGHR
ncbi:hypothetical protein ACVNF4_05650 [Streptomyces sp. S6]